MKRILAGLVILVVHAPVFSQKIDSISFHLYTDSLKKGQHNYINVDGKLSNGHWLPLTAKEIQFSSSGGVFEGNDLVLPANLEEQKIHVRAILKNNPEIWQEITIWVKKLPDPVHLPTKEQILRKNGSKKNEPKDLGR